MTAALLWRLGGLIGRFFLDYLKIDIEYQGLFAFLDHNQLWIINLHSVIEVWILDVDKAIFL